MFFVFFALFVFVQNTAAQFPGFFPASAANDAALNHEKNIHETTQSSGTCILAKLASKEVKVNIIDVLLGHSPTSKRYGRCPTEQELQTPDDNVVIPRIFGGKISRRGQWPWMTYIYETETCKGICGGTLINEEWILTAAHCFGTFMPQLYGVVLGDHEISLREPYEMHRLLKDMIIHPYFDPYTFNNDVALLKLIKPVFFTQYVRPACLPDINTGVDRHDSSTLIGDESCVAMGWGITESDAVSTANELSEVRLNIRPSFVCRFETARNRNGILPVLSSEAKFCAGGEGKKDTCMGDSGGPLVCSINGSYNVVGVTSYGARNCGQERSFGVYAKVANPFINLWIRKHATHHFSSILDAFHSTLIKNKPNVIPK